MRTSIVVLVLLALAGTALAMQAAPEPQFDRHRILIGFGGGYGKISVGDEGVFGETSSTPDDFNVGMAFAIEYAYRIDPTISVGGFVSGWVGTLDGDLGNEEWTPTVLGGAFQYRPGGNGFYLKGGFGAAFVMASIDDPQSEDPLEDYSDYGFGAVAALGYDIEITPNYAAGPRLEFQAMDVGGGVTAVSSALLFTFTF
jgi:hypothetical protein